MTPNDDSAESRRQESLRIVSHVLHWDQWFALVALAGIFLFHEGWYSVILWIVILLGAGFALVLRLTRPEDSL
jgi:hypothetical protein